MPQVNPAIAKQYERWLEADAQAHKLWDKTDRELRKLIRLAKLGRKASTVVPISESRGVRIVNQFKGAEKVFAPAFARKFQVKEVALEAADYGTQPADCSRKCSASGIARRRSCSISAAASEIRSTRSISRSSHLSVNPTTVTSRTSSRVRMIPSVPNLGSQVLSGSSGREFGFLPELPGSLVVHPSWHADCVRPFEREPEGSGTAQGFPLGLPFRIARGLGAPPQSFSRCPCCCFWFCCSG